MCTKNHFWLFIRLKNELTNQTKNAIRAPHRRDTNRSRLRESELNKGTRLNPLMRHFFIIVILVAFLNVACARPQITEKRVMEQAILNINTLMETSPAFRYKKIECLGHYPKEVSKPSRRIRFMDGTWGYTSDLQDVLGKR